MAFQPTGFKPVMFSPISSWAHKWYARWDLNPHVFRQQILSLSRLPISARAHIKFLFTNAEIRTNKVRFVRVFKSIA